MHSTLVAIRDFSLDEVKTRERWINGKSIYRKCFFPITITLGAAGQQFLLTKPQNAESLVHIRALLYRKNFENYSTMPLLQGTFPAHVMFTNDSLVLVASDGSLTGFILGIVLEYTKSA